MENYVANLRTNLFVINMMDPVPNIIGFATYYLICCQQHMR